MRVRIIGGPGSGKTTLLARLLRDPGMADTAVLINEFGEIGIDNDLVVGADEDDPVRAVLGGLPVAGFSGSLTFRFDDAPPAAVGAVRAKTGTLSGVSSLAGTVVTRDGVPMVFALMLDRVGAADEGFAQAALDSAAAALGACRCARGGSGAGGG